MFNHEPVEIGTFKRVNTDLGRRYETPDGNLYPSITTILSHKSKPFIDAWRKKVGAKEANKITRQATARGTSIHKLVEYRLNNNMLKENEGRKTLNPLNEEMYQTMIGMLSKIDNIRAIEQNLYSDHLRLAGQVDCIAEYDGKLSVIDFKTSKKRKVRSHCYNYFMQCSAYAIMFEERTGIPVDQTVVLITQEDDGPMIHVEKRDEFVPQLLEARDAYESFLKNGIR
tara:strand:+ start:492 stop:1172 length:681 start_codon:yes stop_codon:yes gene_type:complete